MHSAQARTPRPAPPRPAPLRQTVRQSADPQQDGF